MSGLFSGGHLCAPACVCVHLRVPLAGVGVGEFEGSVVNPCVMLALALLCRGHPLSFVAGLFRVERAQRKSSPRTVSAQVLSSGSHWFQNTNSHCVGTNPFLIGQRKKFVGTSRWGQPQVFYLGCTVIFIL